MSTTPNLLITHISANQNQKEVTANSAFDELDEALTNLLAVAMSDANYTLNATEGNEALAHLVFKFTGTLTANRNIIVPTNKKVYVVSNQTTGGFSLTVKTASGTGVALSTSGYFLLYCDGTNVVSLAAGGSGATVFTGLGDVPASYSGASDKYVKVNNAANALEFVARPYKESGYVRGVYTASELLVALIVDEAITFPANFANSKAKLQAAVTASTTFVVKKESGGTVTSIGTIVFSSGTVATSFTTTSGAAQTLAAGDNLLIYGPASADATAAGLSFLLRGTF